MPELPKDEKASHAEVKYERPSSHGNQHCGNCEYVINSIPARCQHVALPIFLNGWCKKYEEES